MITVKKVKKNLIHLSKPEAERVSRELELDSSRYIALVDVGNSILIRKPYIGGKNAQREGNSSEKEAGQ